MSYRSKRLRSFVGRGLPRPLFFVAELCLAATDEVAMRLTFEVFCFAQNDNFCAVRMLWLRS